LKSLAPSHRPVADDKKVIVNRLTESHLHSEFSESIGGAKTKNRGFLVSMFAVALSVAPLLVNTSKAAGGYSAQLISPTAGQVVYLVRRSELSGDQYFHP
jgi:hypothetical protein